MKAVIYWFRQDLRLTDLPGLAAAVASGAPVIPCYILDDAGAGDWAPGGASRWWLHHSLESLDAGLRQRGTRLLLLRGDSAAVLAELAAEAGATAVYCSEAYEPAARALLAGVGEALETAGVVLHIHPGSLLYHPDQVRTGAGLPYRVFTPFWRACRQQDAPGRPLAAPGKSAFASHPGKGLAIEELGLLPEKPNWAAGWEQLWQAGEEGARQALASFIADALADYAEARDKPAIRGTSRLSPHLHWGEISPRQVWHAIRNARAPGDKAVDKFLAEIGWREFCYQLLYHHPEIPEKPFKDNFGDMPWLAEAGHFETWKRGQTGYPVVDAGMRELWQTGFMHNRVRMIVASFLTKHLLLPWQWGERWFWDTLVDADLANNSCGWQWVAGCGADAAPYFRIFNPMLQGAKFDPKGDYVRRWVPEIAALPDKHLQAPWEAPAAVLEKAGVELGVTYPQPIVDHKAARETALQAYGVISGGGSAG